ncbi:MAG: M1 family metallopeptidase [Myxococcales bacterium]|nr:M1 family metallopeptidase [Myxococcales bacterium]
MGGATGLACGEAPPDLGTPLPEPTQALRPPDQRGPIPEASRIVDYELEARYDETEHRIDGRTRITWRNHGPAPVDRIPFHLYMNGFRAQDTAWMQQGRGSHRSYGQDPEAPWGYIDIASVERLGSLGSDGNAARTELRHAERSEPSLMDVWLDAPVAPGAEVQLELVFTTHLPKVFARTGYSGRFVLAGQWFPKPGVLMPDGSWSAHPFTVYSEFFADFGQYEVQLDLPADLVVGASGILVSREEDGDRQRLRYRAEMVHDFAWTAGTDLVEAWAEHDGIRIRALVPEARAADAPVHLQAQRATLDSMQARFGPYPWSTITIVDPPPGASGAGGMEYPTFYTTTQLRPIPSVLRRLGFDHRVGGEFTTVHEFGHQYFQGLLASNEFDQPWLDEGLNTFSNFLVYIDEYGPDDADGPWLLQVAGNPLTVYDGLRLDNGGIGPSQPIDLPADRFSPLVNAYDSVTYRKTAAIMMTLRRLAGAEPFDRAMRTYADRFRFRHPTGADLEATLAEELGDRIVLGRTADGRPIELSLADYFEQALRTTRAVDFRAHDIVNRPRLGDAGWHRDEHGELVGGDPPEPRSADLPDDEVEGVVVVHRRGEFVVPVEIEVQLSDGTRERVLWDGTGRYRVLTWPGRRVRAVSIDPEGRLVLETRRYDNTRWAEGEHPRATMPDAMGQLAEASSLAVLGGLGP